MNTLLCFDWTTYTQNVFNNVKSEDFTLLNILLCFDWTFLISTSNLKQFFFCNYIKGWTKRKKIGDSSNEDSLVLIGLHLITWLAATTQYLFAFCLESQYSLLTCYPDEEISEQDIRFGTRFRILAVVSNSKSGFTGGELLPSSHLTSIVRASQLELSHN